MDLGTLIIAAVLVAICIVPFLIMGRNKKKRDKQLLQLLFDTASKENCKITQSEFLNDIAIGLDGINNKLFFLKKIDAIEVEQHVSLLEIKNCGLLNSNRPLDTKMNKGVIIEKIGLTFTPNDKNKTNIVFEFFNSEETMLLSGELQLAQKWEKIINEKLKATSVKKEPFGKNEKKATAKESKSVVPKLEEELVIG
jgi:hypothetical protein